MPDERPQRGCDVCGQTDDHPRHSNQLVAGGTITIRHLDCCASQGCETCIGTEQEYGQRRGQDLIDHLDSVRSI